MKKIASLLCLFILFVTIQPVQAKEIQLFSKYYYLYDRSNEMVYLDEKSDEKIYPARDVYKRQIIKRLKKSAFCVIIMI